MALVDDFLAVELIGLRGFIQYTGVGAKTQGAADIGDAVLVGHQMDDRMRGRRVQLTAVRVLIADDVTAELHDCQLHAEAETQERNAVRARIFDGLKLSGDTAVAEAAGNQDAADIAEQFVRIRSVQVLGFNPLDIHLGIVRCTDMLQSCCGSSMR